MSFSKGEKFVKRASPNIFIHIIVQWQIVLQLLAIELLLDFYPRARVHPGKGTRGVHKKRGGRLDACLDQIMLPHPLATTTVI